MNFQWTENQLLPSMHNVRRCEQGMKICSVISRLQCDWKWQYLSLLIITILSLVTMRGVTRVQENIWSNSLLHSNTAGPHTWILILTIFTASYFRLSKLECPIINLIRWLSISKRLGSFDIWWWCWESSRIIFVLTSSAGWHRSVGSYDNRNTF